MHRSLPLAIGAPPFRARAAVPCRTGPDHHTSSSSSSSSARQHPHYRNHNNRPLSHPPRAKPWRPLADDVERLSSGGAAKRRGTGSFHVPHRLSQDERPPFVAAKKNGYLTIRGSGGRRGSKRGSGGGKGSGRPLLNVWRQWCDAKGWACVVVEQAAGLVAASAAQDDDSNNDQQQQQSTTAPSAVVIVDFSTLRLLDARPVAAKARGVVVETTTAKELGPYERGDGEVPFDVVAAATSGGSSEAEEDLLVGADDEDALERAAEAAAAIAVPGRVPLRRAASSRNDDANDASTTTPAPADPTLPDGHPYATSAIWSIPAQALFFAVEGDASNAKSLAAALATALNGGAGGGGGKSGGKAASAARRRRVFDDYE